MYLSGLWVFEYHVHVYPTIHYDLAPCSPVGVIIHVNVYLLPTLYICIYLTYFRHHLPLYQYSSTNHVSHMSP